MSDSDVKEISEHLTKIDISNAILGTKLDILNDSVVLLNRSLTKITDELDRRAPRIAKLEEQNRTTEGILKTIGGAIVALCCEAVYSLFHRGG